MLPLLVRKLVDSAKILESQVDRRRLVIADSALSLFPAHFFNSCSEIISLIASNAARRNPPVPHAGSRILSLRRFSGR